MRTSLPAIYTFLSGTVVTSWLAAFAVLSLAFRARAANPRQNSRWHR